MFTFLVMLICAEFLVILQGVAACRDGYLCQEQMQAREVTNGWSFLEHGGMWADFFVVSLVAAGVMSKYELAYLSWWGIGLLVVAAIATILPIQAWAKIATHRPEAHAHHGKTTPAGWIHGIYTIFVTWVLVLFYSTPTVPAVSSVDLVMVSSAMTIWAPLGVVKFNRRWKLSKPVLIQVVAEIVVFWIITAVHVLFF